MTNKTKFIFPPEWKKIIAKYPYEFKPRMIFGKKIDGKWIWQAGPNQQIDITYWKLFWNQDGQEILATMDEFMKE